VIVMALALALTTSQLETLRTAAAPLPRSLRSAFLQKLAAQLDGREFGDGELHRLVHGLVRELLAPPPRKQQRAEPSKQQEPLRGFNIRPSWSVSAVLDHVSF
jgi:hypothetical protein